MRLHALSTGTVRVKHSFLYARRGVRRQLSLFTPGPFSDPLPIHLWPVEHEGRRVLVDTGETSSANDVPFAKLDLEPGDIDTVVLTHMHGDHMDGAVHLGGRPVSSTPTRSPTTTRWPPASSSGSWASPSPPPSASNR